MNFSVTVPPSLSPVTLSEQKEHLKILHDLEDSLIQASLKVASTYVESYLKRKLLTQTIEHYLDEFPSSRYIEPIFSPIQSVISITYFDATDVLRTLSTGSYSVDVKGNRPLILSKDSWPTTSTLRTSAITITGVYGWVSSLQISPLITHAIKMIAADLYINRTPDPSPSVLTSAQTLIYSLRLITV